MNFIPLIASVTRIFHPKGTERLLRFFYNPDKRSKKHFEALMDYEGGKIQINTGSFIEWVIYFKGHYEPEVTKFIKSIIKPDSVSIDVGANIGLHAIEMAKGKLVYAFEPNPLVCKRLKENLVLSKISNVEVAQLGLSNVKGSTSFYVPLADSPHQGTSSVHATHIDAESEKIEIETDTLDNLFKEVKKLDFIKIDVEGHDFSVILGAEKIIERLRPVIIFEFCKSWENDRHTFGEVKKFFSSKNYILTTLDGRPCGDKEIKVFTEVAALPSK